MQTLIEKAAVLVEALPFIQKFRGDVVVVKFGGSALEEKAGVEAVLKDIAFMACVGLRPVVVHGGGKAISRRLKEQALSSTFLKGLRVTDAATMEVVEQVLNREVNPQLVNLLTEMGCKARGIYGEDILSVVKHTETDEQTGDCLDWGFVGDVVRVDVEPIMAFSNSNIVPLITPLGWGDDNRVYNCNADEAASAIAEALKARKLVFMSDVPGLLQNPEDPGSLISSVHVKEVDDLMRRGIISGGMLPKVNAAVKALKAGVLKTHFVHAALPHSLLLELFTSQGVGTEIVE